MRISFCELPDQIATGENAKWEKFSRLVAEQKADLLVLNELPFGSWLAMSNVYDAAKASESIDAHMHGLPALHKLDVPAVLTSRPVMTESKLANEAVLLHQNQCTPIHHKHYFPEQPNFFEKTWFEPVRPGFEIITLGSLRIGVLLCTEIMFTEWARHYRRLGANVIAVPRTSGVSKHFFHTAAAMAAIVSGCYVVSSNRSSDADAAFAFGGGGFAFSPKGLLIQTTSADSPVVSIDLDLAAVEAAQGAYPCYVPEI